MTLSKNRSRLEDLATQAWIFGYPLLIAAVSRDVMTATPTPVAMKAPLNQFAYARTTPDASFTDVVSPNADTLYSSGWLDVSTEPQVLSLPDFGTRYWLVPILDAWSDVFTVPGSRTVGRTGGPYLVAGPNWKGNVPKGLTLLRSPTAMNWIVARYATSGGTDLAEVHSLQDRTRLTPLSEWTGDPKAYTPGEVPVNSAVDTRTPPVDQVAAMDGEAFFTTLDALLDDNPPRPEDTEMMKQLSDIGIGSSLPWKSRPQEVRDALDRAARTGMDVLSEIAKEAEGNPKNGWTMHRGLGHYGTHYAQRALIVWLGFGANLDADAVYPHATTDVDGKPLTGEKKYVLHFEKDEFPPVEGFWSLTMMNERQYFVDNPIDRYAIGDRSDLVFADDGSLDIYLQHESPGGEKERNWLPAPSGDFNVFLRLYWPKAAVLSGSWTAPGIREASIREASIREAG
ncbi:hypothetical protein BH686_20865 [Rhodococcus erythropolis]|uniref:DUF1254 domain-containing protein n=1 Tax=Rhodococcus erythropolis TaxID=1833 RepID=UPI000A03883B|nr:DUF1254 domain-containing protein [Rhodococcus erythropolis]ORI24601.1 hypothetical protein BH686_20865 [Rhodococcus erythropolis]